MIRRILIHGAQQIVTVTREKGEKFLCRRDMNEIGVLKSSQIGLSLMIEK